jgi:ABC-2 type transport system permease protein
MAGMAGKRGRITSTVAGVILVAAILVLVNVIAAGSFVRLDLTEQKEFTISRATKDVLHDLNDLATITVYMTEDLPPQLSTLRRQISDMLDEYRNYGRGHIQVDFVDPAKDPQVEQKMRTLGIPQITAQTLDKDQFQAVNIYLGIGIGYLDRQEVIPVVQDTYTLEYDLTSAILKVSREKSYVVGVLTGPVAHDLNRDLSNLSEMLRKQFSVRGVDLRAGQEPVPDDVDLLIIPGPKDVPDAVQYRIDQYLMRGGRILFLVDAIGLPEGGGLQALPVDSGLEDLLAHYGVRVQKGLALDHLNATAAFSSGFVRYSLPYPYWVKAVPDLLNKENPITNRLETLVLPWVAPLEVDAPIGPGDPIGRIHELEKADREARKKMASQLGVDVPPEKAEAAGEGPAGTGEGGPEGAPLTASVLVRTSPNAWTVSGYYNLNPQQRFAPTGDTQAYVTAVALSGKFTSYYQSNPVPDLTAPKPEGEAADEGMEPSPPASSNPGVQLMDSPDTRVVVVGNALFATDQFLGQFPENSVFLLNAIDWMTLGDRLISIRSRGATDRPLKVISDGAKSTIKLVGILGAPVLVVAFGLVRFGLRRKASAVREAAQQRAATLP